ncbi:MAG TPA: hypothetical protein VJ698_19315 [Noviherbaspirillum sp.]|uniref:hypothetical protein n=1 Tax=Noviherbaspirillum sp. TaxID=1926288 RepID=UPI002B484A4D|nr:hypothetical protein [Noviherbaspirillum sp.]HJV87627.1 hypothetical protein [Noviherbaspirillum sp.]
MFARIKSVISRSEGDLSPLLNTSRNQPATHGGTSATPNESTSSKEEMAQRRAMDESRRYQILDQEKRAPLFKANKNVSSANLSNPPPKNSLRSLRNKSMPSLLFLSSKKGSSQAIPGSSNSVSLVPEMPKRVETRLPSFSTHLLQSRSMLSIPSRSSSLLPLSAMTFEGVPEFCNELMTKDIDAAALAELKEALDGKRKQATAKALGKTEEKLVSSSNRDDMKEGVEDDTEEKMGILIVARATQAQFKNNCPDDRLQIRGADMLLRLLELHHADNKVSKATDGYDPLEKELAFWHKAKGTLLEEGLTEEQIAAARTAYINARSVIKKTAENMQNIALRFIAPDQYLENLDRRKTITIEAISADIKESFGGRPNCPSEEGIRELHSAIEEKIGPDKLKELKKAYFDSKRAEKAYNTAVTKERDKARKASREFTMSPNTAKKHGEMRGQQLKYESLKGSLMEQFKTGFLQEWVHDQKASEHLVKWREDLITQAESMTLSPGTPERTTRLLEVYAEGKLRQTWVLEAAVAEANKHSHGNIASLSDVEGERVAAWVSQYFDKAVKHMDATFT